MRLKKALMLLVVSVFVGMGEIGIAPADAASVDNSSFVLQGMDNDGMVNFSSKVIDDNGKSYTFDYRIRLNSDYGAYKIHGEKKWHYWPEPGLNTKYSELDKLAYEGMRVKRTASTAYEADVETVTQNPDTIYTMYLGMPIDEFRGNFSGVTGWTDERGNPFDVNAVGNNEFGETYFNLYKNVSNGSDGCIEFIFCRFYNGTLTSYGVWFFTNSEQIVNKIFTRAVWNYGSKLGYGLNKGKWFRLWEKENIAVRDNGNTPRWDYKKNQRVIYKHCVIISRGQKHQ